MCAPSAEWVQPRLLVVGFDARNLVLSDIGLAVPALLLELVVEQDVQILLRRGERHGFAAACAQLRRIQLRHDDGAEDAFDVPALLFERGAVQHLGGEAVRIGREFHGCDKATAPGPKWPAVASSLTTVEI